MNRIAGSESGSTVPVSMIRLDDFCHKNGILHIDFMKIDTEGYDLTVLQGCGEFIKNIDLIQCEAGANRYNKFHVSYVDIFEFMSSNGFHLFRIFDQTFEWGAGGRPVLRRFDPLFINDRLVGSLAGVEIIDH
jgi:hypothetical protein